MISPEELLSALQRGGVDFYSGVPDSLLKNLCSAIEARVAAGMHVIAANEGNAVAMAAGYHLSTGRIGAVYMQNSGLGNAINPLASLTDAEVYRIPLLLIIGWRGEPGVKDEPQHVKQGRITEGQLKLLEIPYRVLQADSDWKELVDATFADLHMVSSPVAILVRQDTFSENTSTFAHANRGMMEREEAMGIILDSTDGKGVFVSSTGKSSRELYELRVKRGESQQDFLTVGSMGHTSSIALGVALGNPGKRVFCLDGDGSLIMHLGALPVIGKLKPANLVHLVLNNACHESVGGQPTVADAIDFKSLSSACGYESFDRAVDGESLRSAIRRAVSGSGPAFIEVVVRRGSRKDLGRPATTPEENKLAFMKVAGV